VGIVNARNWKKFLKAIRTENPIEVFINISKKLIRTFFKTYKNKMISFQESKPAVLWVLPNFPEKDKSSGERRIHLLFGLIASFLDVYIYTEGVRTQTNLLYVKVIPEISLKKLKKSIPNFQFIVFSWFTTYEDTRILKDLYPNSTLIIDSVDLHWIREQRSLGHLRGLTPQDVADTRQRELKAYSEANQVWVVTEQDRITLTQELPQLDIQVVSNVHPMNALRQNFPKDKKILFLGGFNHYPNIKAAEYLAQNIFPKILSAHPDAQLIIAGSHPPANIIALDQNPNIKVTGFLTDQELEALYNEIALTIVPLFSGSGIKGKICEAIQYGVPVLTNEIGNEGIHLIHQQEGLITPNPNMAEAAIAFFNNHYDIPAMVQAARVKLAQIVAPEVVQKAMLESFFPPVTICIVTHNRKDLLQACIESVLTNTHYPRFQIFVYSNACIDGTVEYLKELECTDSRIRTVFANSNEVFVKPNNIMMRTSNPHDIVLLNNDTTVTPGWLLALHAAAYSANNIGIAGAKLLFPDGTLQEFGGEIKLATGIGFNRGKQENASAEEYQGVRITGYVSGCAMYIKRSTINRVGLLDEQFHPCYFEDADYCYTARNKGLLTVVTAHAIVYHHEGATSGQDESSGMKQYQAINRDKFIAKHSVKP
jgi:GT2 family glycosyltransferase/glycosyltransferase involved in cell wall biosynthesis